VEAVDYANMGWKSIFASLAEANSCVSMEKSSMSVVFVEGVLSVLKNVEIMVDSRLAAHIVEVASFVRVVFLSLSVVGASSVHPAYQFHFEAQDVRRQSLLPNLVNGQKKVKSPSTLHGISRISLQTLCSAASTGSILCSRCPLE
jgi:hypothetical protein